MYIIQIYITSIPFIKFLENQNDNLPTSPIPPCLSLAPTNLCIYDVFFFNIH